MNRPTLTDCKAALDRFARDTGPDDYVTDVNTVTQGDSTFTALTVHYTGPRAQDIPREARLFFGLDGRLTFAVALDPGLFMHAVEEGFDTMAADRVATRRVASFDDVLRYLRGEPYECVRA